MTHPLRARLGALTSGSQRWLLLFLTARVVTAGLAVLVLAIDRLTPWDLLLGWLVLGYATVSVALAAWSPALVVRRTLWIADAAAGLALAAASGDWRSPFFLLALTAIAPPTATLPFRAALRYGGAFTLAWIGVACLTGLEPAAIRSSFGIEILAAHLALPVVVTLGLAAAGDALRQLDAEQLRARRLAVETERRRIAWELHDSAKQRLHAAHLVLSTLPPTETLELGLEQLRGAAADMETSIAELRSPLGGRSLRAALRERGEELAAMQTGVRVLVEGADPALEPVAANHAYRILAEAMANAVRHGNAREVRTHLETDAAGGLRASVTDDGKGLPETIRPGANGLRTMRSRAFAIGGRLTIAAGAHATGVQVRLDVPVHQPAEGVPA